MKKVIISREAMETELEDWGMSDEILAQVRAGERGVTRDGVELFVSPTAAKSASASPLSRLGEEIRADIRAEQKGADTPPASAGSQKQTIAPRTPAPSAPLVKILGETSQELRLRLQREQDKRTAATRSKLPSKGFRRLLGGNGPEAA